MSFELFTNAIADAGGVSRGHKVFRQRIINVLPVFKIFIIIVNTFSMIIAENAMIKGYKIIIYLLTNIGRYNEIPKAMR